MELIYSGKVRDIYDAGDDRLVMVTSDRISAFDRVIVLAAPFDPLYAMSRCCAAIASGATSAAAGGATKFGKSQV